jgi:hypothetical protein
MVQMVESLLASSSVAQRDTSAASVWEAAAQEIRIPGASMTSGRDMP